MSSQWGDMLNKQRGMGSGSSGNPNIINQQQMGTSTPAGAKGLMTSFGAPKPSGGMQQGIKPPAPPNMSGGGGSPPMGGMGGPPPSSGPPPMGGGPPPMGMQPPPQPGTNQAGWTPEMQAQSIQSIYDMLMQRSKTSTQERMKTGFPGRGY